MSSVQPINIQMINQELAIKWSDDTESFFTFQDLRRSCPCATCGSETVWERAVDNTKKPSEKESTLIQLDQVGSYAIQPLWGDNHSTGIFSWDFLRKLDETLKAL